MSESKKKSRLKVAIQDLTPKQDPKAGGVVIEDRPNPTTTLNLNNTTSTLTTIGNTTVKP